MIRKGCIQVVEKNRVIREIKRIASANGGKAPGRLVFEGQTEIQGRFTASRPTIPLASKLIGIDASMTNAAKVNGSN